MRWPVAIAALAIALAGCTPLPAPHDDPVALPQELAWRYAQTCFGDTGLSGEIPRTSYPAACSDARESVKSQACLVHPGVIAAG